MMIKEKMQWPLQETARAKILSPDEMEALPEGCLVWVEHNTEFLSGPRLAPMVMHAGILGNYRDYLVPDEMRAPDQIQMRYRVWSGRPTVPLMDWTPWTINKEWMV